jgi:hypothetical protein
MKTWFLSVRGAITLSAIAWVTELWRAWLDMMFEYRGGFMDAQPDSSTTLMLTLTYTALFGAWAYFIHAAAGNSRGALIANLAINVLVWLALPIAWITTYCTGDCPAKAGLFFNMANWLNLIFGLLAVLAIAMRLRGGRVAAA